MVHRLAKPEVFSTYFAEILTKNAKTKYQEELDKLLIKSNNSSYIFNGCIFPEEAPITYSKPLDILYFQDGLNVQELHEEYKKVFERVYSYILYKIAKCSYTEKLPPTISKEQELINNLFSLLPVYIPNYSNFLQYWCIDPPNSIPKDIEELINISLALKKLNL